MICDCCIAKNVYRVLFKHKVPPKNDMFVPGRMAYVVDLEDDFPESDIPTTAIRSKVSSLSRYSSPYDIYRSGNVAKLYLLALVYV